MGCIYSRNKNQEKEDLIADACSKMKLYALKADDITKVFHRYSLQFHLSIQQLAEALKELQLPFTEECKQLYELFLEVPANCKFIERQTQSMNYDENAILYSVKKLSTIAILLGKGGKREKLIALFFNYDIDASNQLSNWELNILLGDLLEIELNVMPEIAKVIYPDKADSLNIYKESLLSMKKKFEYKTA